MIKKYVHIFNVVEMKRFAIVGLSAAVVHYVAGMGYVHFVTPSVVVANVMAYFTALIVSVLGHMYFSFRVVFLWRRVAKFVVVSLSAMGVSTLTVYGVTLVILSPSIALLMGIVVSAGYTFVLSKVFAFK